LRPSPDTVTMQWYLDGAPIGGATASNYNFQQSVSTPTSRTLELRVTDNSTLVKAEMAGNLMVHSRTWNIQVATPLVLSMGNVSVAEGNSGTAVANFSINLSAPAPAGGVTFDIATTNIEAIAGNAAQPGRDYAASQALGKTIPAGQSSASFAVKIISDRTTEANEVFGVRMSNIIGAAAPNPLAVGTILNDDSSHLLGAGNEGNTGGIARPGKGNHNAECLLLSKRMVDIERLVASRRLKEAEGLGSILKIENRRRQLACR